MKRAKLLLVAAATSLTLFGCQGGMGGIAKTSTFAPEVSSIFISQDSSVASAIVEEYQASDRYNQDELKQEIEQVVITYNKAKGAAEAAENTDGNAKLPVALRSCTLTDQKAVAIFDYAGGNDLVTFAAETFDRANGAERLEVSKVSSGFPTDINYLSTKDQTKVDVSEISKQAELNVVVVEGAVTLQTEGKILYITDGVNLADEFRVVTPAGKSCIVFE